MKSENNLRMQLKEALDNLWARIKSLVSGLDTRVTALEQGGGGGGQANVIEAISFNGTNVPPDASKRVSLQEADPTVPSWAKEASKPTYTASEVGALADTTTFVSGVKGAAEAAYRSGQVELSPVNIGALALSGGEMTGDINMGQSGATSGAKNIKWTTADGTLFYIRPYNNLFQIVRMPSGGTASNALGIYSDGTVAMDNPANWRSALDITPANIGAAAAAATFYSATGNIIKSYGGTGTTEGYGRAVVNIRGKAVEVNFEAQIVTAGTVAALYDVGLSVATLRSLNSSIPAFTASNGGLIHYYTSSGDIATNREGYAGIGEVQTASNQWRLARVYNTSGSVGAWGDDVYTVGMRIVGTVYGTLS